MMKGETFSSFFLFIRLLIYVLIYLIVYLSVYVVSWLVIQLSDNFHFFSLFNWQELEFVSWFLTVYLFYEKWYLSFVMDE